MFPESWQNLQNVLYLYLLCLRICLFVTCWQNCTKHSPQILSNVYKIIAVFWEKWGIQSDDSHLEIWFHEKKTG